MRQRCHRWVCAAALMCLCQIAQRGSANFPAQIERQAARIQGQLDFVFFLPDYLPEGAKPGKPVIVQEQTGGTGKVPDQVYLPLGDRLAMWEMPAMHAVTGRPAEVLPGPGQRYFWLLKTPASDYTTITWNIEGTRLGLTGAYSKDELMKVAFSVRPAAPQVSPRPRFALAPGGIGVLLSWAGGSPVVLEVTPGLAAHRAGVKSGDELVAVGSRSVRGMRSSNVTRMIRGKVGTNVNVTFKRPSGETWRGTLRREPVATEVSVRHRLEDAVRSVPFNPVLPRYLPKGAVLVDVLVTAVKPDPLRKGLQLDLAYQSPPAAVIWIRQSRATGPARQASRVLRPKPGQYVLEKVIQNTAVAVHTYGLPLIEAERVFDSMH